MHKGWILWVLGFGLALPAQAQSYDRVNETRTNAAYFYHVRPGEATVQVSVLGSVRLPGVYEVSVGTDLEKLLSMAGGSPTDVRERGSRQEVTVRLFRQQGDDRTVIYEAPMERMLQEPGQYPTLQDEDVVVVETVVHRGFGWRDALAIVGAVATVTLAVERIISVTR